MPHEALFPLVSTVIHHGGAGTTHTAAKAGVPSVVIPFAADQFFWADRLFRLGIAAPATAQNKIDAASFARQLAFAEQPETRLRAERIGRRMSEENGLEEACNALEKILRMNREQHGARYTLRRAITCSSFWLCSVKSFSR